jgi:hypothetical protein
VLIRLEQTDGVYRWRRLNVSLHHAQGAGDYETLYQLVLPTLEQGSRSIDDTLPDSRTASTTNSSTSTAPATSAAAAPTATTASGKKLFVDGYGPGSWRWRPLRQRPAQGRRLGALSARQLSVRLVRDAGASKARVTLGWLPGQAAPDLLVAELDRNEWPQDRVRAEIAVPTSP